jgi:O-antigen/teichoic acid export membrane protein
VVRTANGERRTANGERRTANGFGRGYNPAVTSATRTVGRNAAVQIAGRAASALLGLALAAALTRGLDVAGYGTLSTALAVLGMLAVLHDFGTTPIAVRTIARDPEEAEPLLGAIADARMRLAAPLAGLGVLALLAAGERGAFLWWALGTFATILAVRGLELVDVALQVAQRMGRSVVATLSGRTVHLALVAILLAASIREPGPLLLATTGGVILSALLRLRFARPWHRLRVRRDDERTLAFLREAMPAGVAAVLMAIYLHVDAPIVRGLAGAREAALYNAPYRLCLLGAGLPGLVMVSASPVLAARWASDRAGFRRGVRKLLGLSVAIGLPAAGGIALAAPALLRVLFGGEYAGAAPTLRWLGLAAALTGPGTVVTAALIAADRAGTTARLAAVALAGNVVLDVVLVSRLGGVGAAIATVATEGVVAVGGTVLLLRVARGEA